MLRILGIGGAVLLVGVHLVVAALLLRWWPDIWIVGLLVLVFFIAREFVPPRWKRRGEPNFFVYHHYAKMWPAPVAARARAELEHCERVFARRRAWLRAARTDDPEDALSVAEMQAKKAAIVKGVEALGVAMATPRRPATDMKAMDKIFDAIADLEAIRRS